MLFNVGLGRQVQYLPAFPPGPNSIRWIGVSRRIRTSDPVLSSILALSAVLEYLRGRAVFVQPRLVDAPIKGIESFPEKHSKSVPISLT